VEHILLRIREACVFQGILSFLHIVDHELDVPFRS
jgi:hypothetical protein